MRLRERRKTIGGKIQNTLDLPTTTPVVGETGLWIDVTMVNDGWSFTRWNIYGVVDNSNNLVKIGEVSTAHAIGLINFTTELQAASGFDSFIGFAVTLAYTDSIINESAYNASNGLYEYGNNSNIFYGSYDSSVYIGEGGTVNGLNIFLKSDLIIPTGTSYVLGVRFPDSN